MTVTLRDMSDEQFTSRYGTDRFTASVITNRLHYVVEHMSTGFLREAFSPIIRDWYDFAATITGPPDTADAPTRGPPVVARYPPRLWCAPHRTGQS